MRRLMKAIGTSGYRWTAKKMAGRKGIKRPNGERHPRPLPSLLGEKEQLDAEERRPYGQAPLQDERESLPPKELAERVERERQDRYSGQVDGIDMLLPSLPVPAVDPQLQAGVFLPRIEMEPVLVGIVVRQIDVVVVGQTVGRDEIVRLVAGEFDALQDEDEDRQIVDEEGRKEEGRDLFSPGPSLEPCQGEAEPVRPGAGDTAPAAEGQREKGEEDECPEHRQPRSEVFPRRIVREEDR